MTQSPEAALRALKVISTWARCGDLNPDHVITLCERTLREYCDHKGYNMREDGRHCPACGTLMTDFGD